MFPSACSLRSTQCAALIALATAAGISRFESVTPADHASTAPSASRETSATSAVRTSYFHLVLQTLAPWLRDFSGSARTQNNASDQIPAAAIPALAPSAGMLAGPPPRVLATTVVSDAGVNVPSARYHSFPFAVGPPRFGATSTPTAAGTIVPCDATANGLFLSRVALNSIAVDARLARPAFFPRRRSTGPVFEPSCADPSPDVRCPPISVATATRNTSACRGDAAHA